MRRREFITLLGGAAMSWPLAAHAQQPADANHWVSWVGHAFRPAPIGRRLCAATGELGWIEGRTIAIEYRWADGRFERFADLSAEIVRLKVDVIAYVGTFAVFAAKQATTVIPIIFATVADPVANGLVASLARPGGNVTGLSVTSSDLAGKRLELLREVVPGLRRLAIMANVDYAAGSGTSARWRSRPTHSRSRSSRRKSGGRRISHQPSRHSRVGGGPLCCW